MSDENYAPVNGLFAGMTVPPCTRAEATRAARKLYRRFGAKVHGAPHQRFDFDGRRTPRKCWITAKTNAGLDKGWQRLVHDISHEVFAVRHHNLHLRPHHPGHAKLEAEIAQYVVASGWLSGALAPKPKPPKGVNEKRLARLVHQRAMARKWQARSRLAKTKLRYWTARAKATEKLLTQETP